MNIDLDRLQKVLDKTKDGLNKLDEDLQLLQLEKNYQNFISQYSPAYLSGSDWYILITYLKNESVAIKYLIPLFLLSNKQKKNNVFLSEFINSLSLITFGNRPISSTIDVI